MRIIEDAERIGTYRSLGRAELFDIEYWELEQATLASARSAPPLTGEVAVLCADSGSCGEELAQGLADSGVTLARFLPGDGINEVCNIVERFGGVDIVISARERPAWWDAARVLLELSPRGVRSISYGHGDSQRWVTVSHSGQTVRLDVSAGGGRGADSRSALCSSRIVLTSGAVRSGGG